MKLGTKMVEAEASGNECEVHYVLLWRARPVQAGSAAL